jgi:hypothetical protein
MLIVMHDRCGTCLVAAALLGCASANPARTDGADAGAFDDGGPGGTTSGTSATGESSASDVATAGVGTSSPSGDTSSSSSTGPEDSPQFDLGGLPDAPGDQPPPATDIDVAITADNAYAFGYGDVDAMATYFGGVAAITAGQIFNCGEGPEQYVVPAEDTAEYLYIVAYADSATTQGVLGQFRRISGNPDGTPGDLVLTGDPGWEVCATGIDLAPADPPPSLETINAQIERCNDDAGDPSTTSGGWVDVEGTELGALAVGETNETPYDGPVAQAGNEFPVVCQATIGAEARWMWFNWDPANLVWPAQSPFLYPTGLPGNPMHDFMIFRLPTLALPQPPAG